MRRIRPRHESSARTSFGRNTHRTDSPHRACLFNLLRGAGRLKLAVPRRSQRLESPRSSAFLLTVSCWRTSARLWFVSQYPLDALVDRNAILIAAVGQHNHGNSVREPTFDEGTETG